MAWRVTRDPAVSREIDIGPPLHRLATSRKRFSSPRAANSSAEPELRGLGKVLLDDLYHHGPATVIGREGLCAARQGDAIEARLDHRKHDAARHIFQREG